MALERRGGDRQLPVADPDLGRALAGRQDHDVARDDLGDGNFVLCAIPKHRRFRLHDGEQPVDRMRGAALLPEPQHAAGQDDHEDDQGVGGVVQNERQSRREEEDQDERALELAEQEDQLAGVPPRLENIGADTVETPRGVGAPQPPRGRVELPEHVGGRNAPEAVGRLVHAWRHRCQRMRGVSRGTSTLSW